MMAQVRQHLSLPVVVALLLVGPLYLSIFGESNSVDRRRSASFDDAPLDAPEYSSTSIRVADGDTFRSGGTRFRLFGIDAPESDQMCWNPKTQTEWACGTASTAKLSELIQTYGPIRCRSHGTDPYGRELATCYGHARVTPGSKPVATAAVDLNRELIRAGLAVSYDAPGVERPYKPDEQLARSQSVGMWSGSFQPPHLFRRDKARGRRSRPIDYN